MLREARPFLSKDIQSIPKAPRAVTIPGPHASAVVLPPEAWMQAAYVLGSAQLIAYDPVWFVGESLRVSCCGWRDIL